MARLHLEWLYPGLGIKRWLLIGLAGSVLLVWSVLVAVGDIFSRTLLDGLGMDWMHNHLWAAALVVSEGVVLGLAAVALAVRGIVRFERPTPDTAREIRLYARLARGPRVVAIGGGTGLAVLLRGLKYQTSNLTAIVTVADDGGSSGRLRQDLGILPPGDIRNCLVALADDESLMSRLFQYRFASGGLQGHCFGNLFVAALAEVTGDFERAVAESTSVLKVRGRVLPATLDNVILHAQLQGGAHVIGESTITAAEHLPQRVWLTPSAPRPLPEALAAVAQAQLVVLGPGSLYTSILPNLLVDEMSAALRNTPAEVVYVCNVMSQPGETDGYSAADHVAALFRHGLAGMIDIVLVNDTPLSADVEAAYQVAGARPVVVDVDRLEQLGVRVVHASLATGSDVVRHDPARLSEALLRLAR
ncbi:MAG: gluconeogenesis factor YvcK family protein [Thermoleophilia bacterium]